MHCLSQGYVKYNFLELIEILIFNIRSFKFNASIAYHEILSAVNCKYLHICDVLIRYLPATRNGMKIIHLQTTFGLIIRQGCKNLILKLNYV